MALSVADRSLDFRLGALEDEGRCYLSLLDRLYEMQHKRQPWEVLWREIWKLVLPERESLIQWFDHYGSHSSDWSGFIKNIGKDIYNLTAPAALVLMVAGLQGYLVSRQEKWFAYAFPHPAMHELSKANMWLEECERICYQDLARSTFYDQLNPLMLDGPSSGTATQRFFYDEDTQKHIFETLHPLEVYIDRNWRHEIDTVYHVFRMSRREAVQFFGAERLSKFIMSSQDSRDDFMFLHAVFPRDEIKDADYGLVPHRPGSPLSIDAPWCSIYAELPDGYTGRNASGGGSGGGTDRWGNQNFDRHYVAYLKDNKGAEKMQGRPRILSIGGYQEFPFCVWRWEVDSSSLYGTSIARKLLPNIYQANDFTRLVKRAGYRALEPPLYVSSNLRQSLRLTPGAITYGPSDPNTRIEPIATEGIRHSPFTVDREDRMNMQIRQLFGVDIFMLVSEMSRDGRTKTATEVYELMAEKSAVLASSMGRLSTDVFNRVLDQVFGQALRRGRLPPPPQSLQRFIGTDMARLSVDYIGPLAQAQKRLISVQGPMRILEQLTMLAQAEALPGETMRRINFSELAKIIATQGMPLRAVYTDAEVRRQREIEAEQIEKQQQMDQLEAASRSVRNAGPMIMEPGAAGQAPAAEQTVLPSPAAVA